MTAVEGVNYGYDNNGNQTSRGSDTFTFDHEDRMTQSVVGGTTSSSVYYGDGVRKSHTVNGTTTNYKYDVLAGLPVVIQDGTYTYVYGLDLISMTDGSGNQKYFSYDGLGSVTDITNGSGTVTDTFVYDVFGAVAARTGTTVSIGKFTGEQADDGTGDSGFYFLRARHYDPATGRFVGRDKIEFSQPYAYVGGNPVRFTDPSGMWCLQCFLPGPVLPAIGVSIVALLPPMWVVVGGAAVVAGAVVCYETDCLEIFRSDDSDPPTVRPNWEDPDAAPGSSWERRGRNWWNPETGESLSPDLEHDEPIGPHYDYQRRGERQQWRMFPDGRVEPK